MITRVKNMRKEVKIYLMIVGLTGKALALSNDIFFNYFKEAHIFHVEDNTVYKWEEI